MLSFYTYQLPFKKPFQSAGKLFKHREGIIIVFKEDDIEAYGEVAPLPGFSVETLDEVREVLKLNYEHLQQSLISGEGPQLLNVLNQVHQFPSLAFGIDTLIHDLKSKRKGIPLGQYLFDEFPDSISANATLPLQVPDNTIEYAQSLIKEGFQTLKIKVGENFDNELDLIQKLRKQFPDINIRIDANEAWSRKEAVQHLGDLQSLNIEYCEQPISKNSVSDLKEVTSQSSIPIAADESIRNKKEAIELSENSAANLFILKPMLLGTFDNIFVTNRISVTHNIESVYTTSLESTVGRAATAVLAGGFGRKFRAQGLATGSLFKYDVSNSEWLNKPVISFPNKPGLGIKLNLEGLKKLF